MKRSHPLRLARFWLAVLLLAATGRAADVAAAPAKTAPAVPNSECLDCHEAEFKPRKKGLAPEWIGVKPDVYAHSAHAKLACVDCHTSIKETPHETKLPAVQCAACHEKSLKTHAFHPRLGLTPIPAGDDTSCVACHGAHDTVPVKQKEFAFASAAQVETCGRCHEAAAKDYLASAHAARPEGAKRITPDCLGCHQERIASPGPGRTPVELKLVQAKLCESCHVGKPEVAGQSNLGAKFVASFDHSVHGAALQAGKAASAGCIDCHGAHAMNKAAVAGSRISRARITATCAKCHEVQAQQYGTSVHALALRKGNLDSAGCTSCHGEHDIKLHTDPTATVNKANLAQKVCD
jgi:nitrate/TMAO reductase-like tetraheme cytochrome c subunit